MSELETLTREQLHSTQERLQATEIALENANLESSAKRKTCTPASWKHARRKSPSFILLDKIECAAASADWPALEREGIATRRTRRAQHERARNLPSRIRGVAGESPSGGAGRGRQDSRAGVRDPRVVGEGEEREREAGVWYDRILTLSLPAFSLPHRTVSSETHGASTGAVERGRRRRRRLRRRKRRRRRRRRDQEPRRTCCGPSWRRRAKPWTPPRSKPSARLPS